jgi:hypothetical protein
MVQGQPARGRVRDEKRERVGQVMALLNPMRQRGRGGPVKKVAEVWGKAAVMRHKNDTVFIMLEKY